MQRIWMKLALILLLVGGGGILLSTILSVQEMEYHFSMYVHELDRLYANQLVKKLEQTYAQENGFGPEAKRLISEVSQVLQLDIQLHPSALLPSDSNAHTMSHSISPPYPIEKNGRIVGYLSISRGSTMDTHGLEEHFQTAHTSAMIWTMIILTFMVGIMSLLVARRMVRPVVEVSQAARHAARGDLTVQVTPLSSGDELSDLVTSFNQLVCTLQAQEELRKRLTSDVAHELRTPLNTILAQVEAMIDGIWSASPEHLESTRGEVLRLSRLVSDLDQVMKAEAGEHHLQIVPIDLAELVMEVTRSMQASFELAGVNLHHTALEGIILQADRQRLTQILVNLLSNSLKHTPSGGTVEVRVKALRDRIILEVQDTGVGIAQADLHFVFQRFYRGDRSRQRETGGSGLGLTIVKGLVEAHQGTINIMSKQGQGTLVTITLPQTFHQG